MAIPIVPLIAAGAGILGSAIGGIFSSHATNSTNKTNLLISRENQEFQKKMWDLQNAYNTPAAQMARAREAGLNPYLAGIQPGTAGSYSGPAPAVMQPNTAWADAARGMGNSVSHALMQIPQYQQMEAQNKLLTEQAETQRIENQFRATKLAAEIAKTIQDKNTAYTAENFQKETLSQLVKTFDARQAILNYQAQQERLKVVTQQLTNENMQLTNANLRFENETMNPLRKQELTERINSIITERGIGLARLALDKQITAAQVRQYNAQTAKIIEDTVGSNLQNQITRKSINSLVQQSQYTARKAFYDMENSQKHGYLLDEETSSVAWDNRNKGVSFVRDVVKGIGGAAGTVKTLRTGK